MFLRAEYNYDMSEASKECALVCSDKSLTRQSEAEEADINVLIERFGLGVPMPVDLRVPLQGDFESIMDFQGAMNIMIEGREAFMQLPPKVRARFGNDPGAFLDFVYDDANYDEAVKMGVALPRPVEVEPAPMKVEVVAPAGAPPVAPGKVL